MDWLFIAYISIAAALILDKVWRHVLIVCFFRRPAKTAAAPVRMVSILQPIVSGDPALAICLEETLATKSEIVREIIWLVDDADAEAIRLCQDLAAKYSEFMIRIVPTAPAPDGCSPKLAKLIAGMKLAQGDVICVLDDDTVIPEGGLETCLPFLELPGAGLAFGLPYYVSFDNFWTSLIACFVNSHSLATYVPYTYLVEPVTINGMFYMFRREVYDAIGGFEPILPICADDFAVAWHFRNHGYRLMQTPVRHAIRTTVFGPGAYFRLLHRWFTFPRETLMKAMPVRDRALAILLGLGAALGPVVFAIGLAIWPWTWGLAAGYALTHFLSFAHIRAAYLRRSTPWRWAWLVPLVQLLLPIQLAIALVTPQRINWRGHIMQIEPGGGFRFLSRRRGA